MKISVALCTYNGQKFLRKQVDSILVQSVAVSEIIVCDDASTDLTLSILKEYEQAYPGLFNVICNRTNIGVVRNFEQTIRFCTGDIIFFCDQDDVWEDCKVKRVLDFFNEFDDVYGVFTDATLIDERDTRLGKTIWEYLQFREALILDPRLDVFRFLLLYRNIVTGACLAVKREALDIIMPFPSDGSMLHDQWIGLRLGALNKIGLIDECLSKYRVHPKQETKLIWRQANKQSNSFRSALFTGNAGMFPYDYYRYWLKKITFLNGINLQGVSINSSIIKDTEKEVRKGFVAYIKTLSFCQRKLKVIYFLLRNKREVRFSDLWEL